jgi:colanic acid/amylovoran biosynthesis glycosyltransferase
MNSIDKKLNVAFVVGEFPTFGLTYLINQVADLVDRGIEVTIFAMNHGSLENVSERYEKYQMNSRTYSLEVPKNPVVRIFSAIPKLIKIFRANPRAFFRVLNIKKYGRNALALKLIFWTEPFIGKEFDLVHCHFGPIANKFLIIREILGLKQKIVTSFYGYDVSHIPKEKGIKYYDNLKKACHQYFVMSNNMKERVVALGFSEKEIEVLPVSVDVESYPFAERTMKDDEPFHIISVGRFVEKKGFDDLLRAVAVVKEKTNRKFLCSIVGGGELEKELHALADELAINDVVEWKGYMKIEDVISFYMKGHLFAQSSKTAKDGDME